MKTYILGLASLVATASFLVLTSMALASSTPTITSITPSSGLTTGSTTVTIAGTEFATGATVTFDGTSAIGITFASSTGDITATTPAGTVGPATVVVTNLDGGAATSTTAFSYVAPTSTPTITSITPSSGLTTGSTSVTISGTQFATGATVTFNGASATGITVASSTDITATTPPGSVGPATVVVTNLDGGTVTSTTTYTYMAPTPTYTVTIDKFLNGIAASTTSTTLAFPMDASWSDTPSSGSGSFTLSPTGFNSPNAYEAITSPMDQGATYTTNEVMSAPVVSATCDGTASTTLMGYSVGTTLAAAMSATSSLTAPNFPDLTSNEYVIVWNRNCYALPAPTLLSPPNGTTTTTAGLTSVSWNSVTDPAGGITYVYQASNTSAQNPDGSFTTPVYTSGPLSTTTLATPGTPAGTYFWHVEAMDADQNTSPWSLVWMFTVSNPPPPPPANACSTTGAPAGYTLQTDTRDRDSVALAPFTMFVGKGGNYNVTGPDGNYIVCIGAGNATVTLGNGSDTVFIGGGRATITLGSGTQTIMTGDGNATITTGAGNDTITTGSGNTTINAGTGDDTIVTGTGNHFIDAGGGASTCTVGYGRNTIRNCTL